MIKQSLVPKIIYSSEIDNAVLRGSLQVRRMIFSVRVLPNMIHKILFQPTVLPSQVQYPWSNVEWLKMWNALGKWKYWMRGAWTTLVSMITRVMIVYSLRVSLRPSISSCLIGGGVDMPNERNLNDIGEYDNNGNDTGYCTRRGYHRRHWRQPFQLVRRRLFCLSSYAVGADTNS